jgi:hypothetical protein
MKKLLVLFAVAALFGGSTIAAAHRPDSDGGAAERDCGVITGVSKFGPVGVGATDVRCRKARRIARGSVKGESFARWRCTGEGTRFGHCHRRGERRVKVHWYAAEQGA